jgi:hypothetical protein
MLDSLPEASDSNREVRVVRVDRLVGPECGLAVPADQVELAIADLKPGSRERKRRPLELRESDDLA